MSKNKLTKKSPEATPDFGIKFIQTCFYILFFLTPLLLWPFTSEVFEFNKMIFVYLMTTIITSAWAIRTFYNKKFEFVRTPLDLPFFLFLLSQIISTIISIDPHTSLWGYYSRFHGGLVSTICYTLLFYAFVTHFNNNTKAVKNVINAILISAAITAFYGVLEHFGIDKNIWVQDVQNRVFSTLGQPNWLSAYLIAIMPLSLHLAISNRASQAVLDEPRFRRASPLQSNANHVRAIHESPLPRLIYGFLSLLFLITIIYTKSQSGLAATFIVLILAFIYYAKKYSLLLIPIFLLTLIIPQTRNYELRTLNSLMAINPFYSNTLDIAKADNITRGNGGSDSMVIRRVVWDGAIKLGLSKPFFGNGVETFGYSYYWKRSLAHNYTSETDFLYNKAHNEYLNFFANSGFFGLLSYLFLIFSIIKIFISNQEPRTNNQELRTPLMLGFASIMVTNYFGFSVVNIALFFFLFPAIYISLKNVPCTIYHVPLEKTTPLIIISLLTLWNLIGVRNIWLADLHYVKGRSNLEENLKAVKLNPKEPLYYSQLGYIQALIATQIIAPQVPLAASKSAELAAKAQGYLDSYSKQALENSQKAINMNPYHTNLYKSQARTLVTLATLDPKYFLPATQSMLKIAELSPTDPLNYYNLGILYTNLNKKEEARLAFEKVLELYPLHQGAIDQLAAQKNPAK